MQNRRLPTQLINIDRESDETDQMDLRPNLTEELDETDHMDLRPNLQEGKNKPTNPQTQDFEGFWQEQNVGPEEQRDGSKQQVHREMVEG